MYYTCRNSRISSLFFIFCSYFLLESFQDL